VAWRRRHRDATGDAIAAIWYCGGRCRACRATVRQNGANLSIGAQLMPGGNVAQVPHAVRERKVKAASNRGGRMKRARASFCRLQPARGASTCNAISLQTLILTATRRYSMAYKTSAALATSWRTTGDLAANMRRGIEQRGEMKIESGERESVRGRKSKAA